MGGYVAWWSDNRLHIQRLCGLRVTELQQSKASNLKVILLLGRVHFQFVLITKPVEPWRVSDVEECKWSQFGPLSRNQSLGSFLNYSFFKASF